MLYAGRERASRPSIAQIFVEDSAIIGAVAMAAHPELRDKILSRMPGPAPTTPTLRIVLSWETDANDVDLHVEDRTREQSYYAHRSLGSGGALRDDITTGYGPEMFQVDYPDAYPYKLSANYYRQGPMGIGLGSTQIIHYDGAGHLTVEDRPFAIQSNLATVELGVVDRPCATLRVAARPGGAGACRPR